MRRFEKVFGIMVFLLVLPGLLLLSADKTKGKERVITSSNVITVKGELRNFKDAEKTWKERKTKPDPRPVLNFENPRKIKVIHSNYTNDPVVVKGPELAARTTAAVQNISGFAGMNLSQNGAGWPPDTCGDVGNTYFVQAVNTSIGIYNKSTGAAVSTTTFDAFFEGASVQGTPCDEDNWGDPIVLYDWYADRWVIFDFAWYSGHSNGFWFSIAASKTSDPTGDWWLYAFQADPVYINDYPKGGVWEDGIYITANMFNFDSGSFQGVKVWTLKKPDLYNGTLTALSVFDNSYEAWSILPGNAKGNTAPPSGEPNYMFALDADEYGGPSIDAIYYWKADVNWSTSTFNWIGPYTMTTAPFGLTANTVPQKRGIGLDSLYGRLMNSAIYRKFATYTSVYLCHLVEYSRLRTMRWYEIRINSGTCSINQQSTYAPDSNHRWMGSIGADKDGKIAMGYSISSRQMYPSIRVLDCTNTVEATLKNGSGSQSTYNRWGDYSQLTIDPVDDKTIWYTNEYYISSGTNWQTWISSFKVN